MFLTEELTHMFLQYKIVCLNKRSIQIIKKVNTKHTFKCMHISKYLQKNPLWFIHGTNCKKKIHIKTMILRKYKLQM